MSRSTCRVLVVDDEAVIREVVQARVQEWGFPVRTARTVGEARAALASFDPHVVISDLVLPDASGLALVETLRAGERPGAPRTILMITAYGTIDTAVQAIKLGASDFLTKPLDYVAVRRWLDEAAAQLSDAPAPRPPPPEAAGGMVGHSAAMQRMWAGLEVAASRDVPVLIVGESGVGKELVARTIHARGRRHAGPFVPVNAAAIPEALAEGELFGAERGAFTGATEARPGLIEEAHRGTLFLDEVTEMPAALQPKFLRVLEDGRVRRLGSRVEMACDVRLIAATNRDPADAVAEGRLRHDLLYRLDVLRVEVPPLRHRLEDLPALVEHFLADCAARYAEPAPAITPAALEVLAQHAWPGNVRELRNAIERAFAAARGEPIAPAHLHLNARADSAPGDHHGIVIPRGVTAAEAERILILETLKATANNKAEAARRLGLDVKTIRNKLKTFDTGGAD